jgi:glycosyltransferase involved in cell wall biosynthesis
VPYFSICIPQYNRTRFLLESLHSIAEQSFQDFEVCISDGGSTDNGRADIECALSSLGFAYKYSYSQFNLPYDQNLRAAIALSSGRFCFLLGNDDRLSSKDTLQLIHDIIEVNQPVAVAITNYFELPTNKYFRRAPTTKVMGHGPEVASVSFRNYSFVSGLILDATMCHETETARCDGSEMYQMYLATRLVASGGNLLHINLTAIDKDIQLPGQIVDSYRLKSKSEMMAAPLPMTAIPATIDLGLELSSGVDLHQRRTCSFVVLSQLYLFTYPFWIIEFKRIHGLSYACWFINTIRPSRILKPLQLGFIHNFLLWLIYLICSSISVVISPSLFSYLRPALYAVAKCRWFV